MKQYLLFGICGLLVMMGTGVSGLSISDGINAQNTVFNDHGASGLVYSAASDNNNVLTGFDTGWNSVRSGGALVATFTPQANESIHILGLGIGGDVGGNESTVVYHISGGGLDFAFAAGKSSRIGNADLYLGAANATMLTQIGGSADLTAAQGQEISIRAMFRNDNDGGRMQGGTDPFGNSFNDNGVSTSAQRVWMNFEVVTNNAVPEPNTVILSVLALLSFFFVRKS